MGITTVSVVYNKISAYIILLTFFFFYDFHYNFVIIKYTLCNCITLYACACTIYKIYVRPPPTEWVGEACREPPPGVYKRFTTFIIANHVFMGLIRIIKIYFRNFNFIKIVFYNNRWQTLPLGTKSSVSHDTYKRQIHTASLILLTLLSSSS